MFDKKPPFGDKPPMGMPPMDGKPPFDGPPPEMPEQDVSHMKNKRLDLRYGDEHPRQVFDIYYPEEGDGPWPVLFHMHGGGFALGDKRDFHIEELLDCGHLVIACHTSLLSAETFVTCRFFYGCKRLPQTM